LLRRIERIQPVCVIGNCCTHRNTSRTIGTCRSPFLNVLASAMLLEIGMDCCATRGMQIIPIRRLRLTAHAADHVASLHSRACTVVLGAASACLRSCRSSGTQTCMPWAGSVDGTCRGRTSANARGQLHHAHIECAHHPLRYRIAGILDTRNSWPCITWVSDHHLACPDGHSTPCEALQRA
jgi:hypothetical protein